MATTLHSSPQQFDGGLAGLSLRVGTGDLAPIATTVEHREREGEGEGEREGEGELESVFAKNHWVCELTGI